jgi:hypothetical protein
MDLRGATILILGGSGSGNNQDRLVTEPADSVVPRRMATRVFRHEDAGERGTR